MWIRATNVMDLILPRGLSKQAARYNPDQGRQFMWIVRLALRRPYTFVVMAMLITLLGGVAVESMPVDIFPNIDLPVLSVIFNYNGLSAEEMANRVVTIFERQVTSNVNDIEHIESQSYNGICVLRLYLQPGARVELAQAQVVSSAQSALRIMPPGMF